MDKDINIRQYILGPGIYTAGNSMSLCNIAFQWLASGFTQLRAAGCRCNILHFQCVYEGKMLLLCFQVLSDPFSADYSLMVILIVK